jgi:hypothetical protein
METPFWLFVFAGVCYALALGAEKRSMRRKRHHDVALRLLHFKRPEVK